MSENNIEATVIKIGLLGDGKVGKSAICNRFLGLEFNIDTMTTIGSEKFEKKINLKNGKEIRLILWDTAGQERFRSAALRTIKFVQGIVLVFDVSDKKSFENINMWLEEINDNFENPCLVLFGNKIDKPKKEWEITPEEIKEFAKQKKMAFFETSAKENIGLDKGLTHIANEAYEKLVLKGKVDPKNNEKKIDIGKGNAIGRRKCCKQNQFVKNKNIY